MPHVLLRSVEPLNFGQLINSETRAGVAEYANTLAVGSTHNGKSENK